MSCRYRFECESDKILALRLNKLERSNRTLNHHFICKFDRENESKGTFRKSRFVCVVIIVFHARAIKLLLVGYTNWNEVIGLLITSLFVNLNKILKQQKYV